ncbi:hypothetical protein B5X24_HaOG213462 [Helicoverpa armigera]|nr:hypothetical protein B5X24_HaOG213462 [Helicoverpa armigera]
MFPNNKNYASNSLEGATISVQNNIAITYYVDYNSFMLSKKSEIKLSKIKNFEKPPTKQASDTVVFLLLHV